MYWIISNLDNQDDKLLVLLLFTKKLIKDISAFIQSLDIFSDLKKKLESSQNVHLPSEEIKIIKLELITLTKQLF